MTKKDKNRLKLLLTAIGSAILAIVIGVLTNQFSEKNIKLTYDVTTLEKFSGTSQNIGIFGIRIRNEGEKEIENVLGNIEFTGATIIESIVSGIPKTSRKEITSNSKLEINIPFLNPDEQVSIQILLEPSLGKLSIPKINLRGKGIVGSKVTKNNNIFFYWTLAITAFSSIFTFLMFNPNTKKEIKRLDKKADEIELAQEEAYKMMGRLKEELPEINRAIKQIKKAGKSKE